MTPSVQKEKVQDDWSMPYEKLATLAEYAAGEANAGALNCMRTLISEVTKETEGPNPIIFYGPTGCGKTHLLQGIARELADHGKRAMYLSSEKFMYGFVSTLRTARSPYEVLHDVDVLLIDDVQFITGKVAPEEFARVLRYVKQVRIVLTSDHAVHEIDNLDDATKAVIRGGLAVEIKQPEENLRFQILEFMLLRAQTRQPGFNLREEVLRYVAKTIDSSGRDLSGAMNRLLARHTLSGTEVTLEDAEMAIRDLVRVRDPKKVRIDDIQKLVATHYSVSRADLLSSRRTASVVRPRQIAMYLSKVLTPRSLPEIGRRFGGRDHTTVLHAVRKIEGLAAESKSLKSDLAYLQQILTEA